MMPVALVGEVVDAGETTLYVVELFVLFNRLTKRG